MVQRRLPDRQRELWGILARPHTDVCTRPEMALDVANHRQLGPVKALVSWFALSPDVVAADVATLQSRGVDGGAAALREQSRHPRHSYRRAQQGGERPL